VIPSDFREWACSLSGCDGGNIEADLWICGIEWGQGSYENGKYYREELPLEIRSGRYAHNQEKYDWQASLDYPYGRSFAKLYASIHDCEIATYKNFISKCDGSEVFKLNLYPIAFDSTDPQLWAMNGLDKLTGFPEKHLFQTWCFLNRFPTFSKLVRDHSPKIIIGTGVSYLKDFFVCFGGEGQAAGAIQYGELEPASSANKRSKRRYYWVKLNEMTTLVVVPFFSGSHGLNSDHLLHEMGIKIGAMYT